MNEQVQTQRAPREWVELTTVTNPATPIVVRVQTTATGRPLYSMEISILRDGRTLRHMPIFLLPDSSVTPTDTAILTEMIRQAEHAVEVDSKKKAAEWQAKQGRDTRGTRDDHGGGRKPTGGKKGRRERDDESRWR